MEEEYLGIVKLFAGSFAPRGWMFCWGQLLPVQQYTALFSLLGTSFGGDGRVNFGLPDLRGRVPIGAGHSASSGVTYVAGKVGGAENVQLGLLQLPAHTHTATFTPTGGGGGQPIAATVTVNAGTAGTASGDPTGAYWGKSPGSGPTQSLDYTNQKNVTMAADAVQVSVSGGGGITGGMVTNDVTGSGQPFSNMQPYQAMNYIICVEGLYPPRND